MRTLLPPGWQLTRPSHWCYTAVCFRVLEEMEQACQVCGWVPFISPRRPLSSYHCLIVQGGRPSAWPWLCIWFKFIISDLMGKQLMGVPQSLSPCPHSDPRLQPWENPLCVWPVMLSSTPSASSKAVCLPSFLEGVSLARWFLQGPGPL